MSNEGNKSKTKIFIPAGTVPADKDAILEIPFDGHHPMVAKKVSGKIKRISSAPSTSSPTCSQGTCSQGTPSETPCNNEWQLKEQEERDMLLHQLDQYQKARRQYLDQLSKSTSKPDNYFSHLTVISIGCQTFFSNKSAQIQTLPHCSFCSDVSTQTYPKQQETYPIDEPVFCHPSLSEPQECNSIINKSNLAPCYNNIQQNASKQHCDLCDRLYKTLIDDKETKELWKNDNQRKSREAFPSHSDNDIGDIMNKLEEAKMKLDKCKSLVSGNDDCNLRNEFQFANYPPCCSFDWRSPNHHCKTDNFDSKLKQSEEDFKKRTEQLKQTLTKLLNTVSSQYINMFGNEHSQSNLTDACCQSASHKSILKRSTDITGNEFKKNVTVYPEVETILLKKEETPKGLCKMKFCSHHPETDVDQLKNTVITCSAMKTPQPEKRQESCEKNSCLKNKLDPEKQFAYDLGSMNCKTSTPRKVANTDSTRVQIKGCCTENQTCSHKQ